MYPTTSLPTPSRTVAAYGTGGAPNDIRVNTPDPAYTELQKKSEDSKRLGEKSKLKNAMLSLRKQLNSPILTPAQRAFAQEQMANTEAEFNSKFDGDAEEDFQKGQQLRYGMY